VSDSAYADFSPEVTDRRALADLVKNDPGLAKAHARFLRTLETWWDENEPALEGLAPKKGKRGNVYDLRRQRLASISAALAKQRLLTDHQVRGAFARYVHDLKADLKSVAASGWGPELIPDSDILESQFPELLAEMEQKRSRLAELTALFAAADEEDYEDSDDTGVLPGGEVKALKAQFKEASAQAKLAKKEGRKSDWNSYAKTLAEIEERLARYQALEDETKQLKSDLRANEKKQEELVIAAREKINRDEARRVIIDRLHRMLVEIYNGYLQADERACVDALVNLHNKYSVTAKAIEVSRDADATKLKAFLVELGYE
jgi:type I restriction enzyme M protein